MKTLVTVLSYRRRECLARTLGSFLEANAGLFGSRLSMIALDQCPTEATLSVFREHRRFLENVYTSSTNRGIGWGYSQLVELASLHDAPLVLHLEDDWVCKIPLVRHLDAIESLLETRPDVGLVRLRTIDDPRDATNHATGEPVSTEAVGGRFLVGNLHFVFNPHLARSEVVRRIVPLASEHQGQIRYQGLGLACAQLVDRMFVHVGEVRAPGRVSRVPEPFPVVPHSALGRREGFVVPLPEEAP